MACTNKADLIAVSEKEYAKLQKLIAPLDPAQSTWGADGVSVKDVIGHRAHWTALFFGWYNDGMAGKEVFFPAEGYKWNDLKRYNADLRKQQAHLDWDEARAMLDKSYAQLIEFLSKRSDAELYGGPMQGANNKWSPSRWAEAAGPSHYRSAAKFIRGVLRQHA